MKNKSGKFIIIFFLILLCGCIQNSNNNHNSYTIWVYYENLWNHPPTDMEPKSYNISIFMNDYLIYTTQHNTSYEHPDVEKIGTYDSSENNIQIKAVNEDYFKTSIKDININKYYFIVISFSYNETLISCYKNEPTFQ